MRAFFELSPRSRSSDVSQSSRNIAALASGSWRKKLAEKHKRCSPGAPKLLNLQADAGRRGQTERAAGGRTPSPTRRRGPARPRRVRTGTCHHRSRAAREPGAAPAGPAVCPARPEGRDACPGRAANPGRWARRGGTAGAARGEMLRSVSDEANGVPARARGGGSAGPGHSGGGGGAAQAQEAQQEGSVCQNCRRLKKRCDRQTPCGSCRRLQERDPSVQCVRVAADEPRPPNLVPDDDVRALGAPAKLACVVCRKRKKRCMPDCPHRVVNDAAHAPAKTHPSVKAAGATKTKKSSSTGKSARGERPKPKSKRPSMPALFVRKVGTSSGGSSIYRKVVSCADCRRKKQRCLHGLNGQSAVPPSDSHQKAAATSSAIFQASAASKQACALCRKRKKRCTHLLPAGPHDGVDKGKQNGLFKSRAVLFKPATPALGGNLSAKERKRERDRQRRARIAAASAAATAKSATVEPPTSSSASSLPSGKSSNAGMHGKMSGGDVRMRGVNGSTLVRWVACDKCRKRRIRCLHMKAVAVNTAGSAAVKAEAGTDESLDATLKISQLFKSAKRGHASGAGEASVVQSKKRKMQQGREADAYSKPAAAKTKAWTAPSASRGKEAADAARFVPCLDCKRKKRKCWCNVVKPEKAGSSSRRSAKPSDSPKSVSKSTKAKALLAIVKSEANARPLKQETSTAAQGASSVFSSSNQQEEVNWLLEFAQLAQVSATRASCLLPSASCLLPPAACLLPPASCPRSLWLRRAAVGGSGRGASGTRASHGS